MLDIENILPGEISTSLQSVTSMFVVQDSIIVLEYSQNSDNGSSRSITKTPKDPILYKEKSNSLANT